MLCIEDNASNARLIEVVLEKYCPGVTLMTACEGAVGLELARQHQPGLILLDLHLPDIMGWDVMRLLRESPATANIHVVITSADATAKQVARLLSPPEGEPRADGYLTKPLSVTELLRVLRDSVNIPVTS